MKTKITIILSIVIGLVYIATNSENIPMAKSVVKKVKSFTKDDKTTNINNIEQNEYSKVVMPKEMQEIEHGLVDMQNDIAKDKYVLDKEVENSFKDDNIDETIEQMDKKIAMINEELNMTDDTKNEIENRYAIMMKQNLTSKEAKQVQADMIKTDDKLLKVEKDFNDMLNGDIK